MFLGERTTCDGSPDFCLCPSIVSSIPENCAVDARYPHPPESTPQTLADRIGFDSVVVTLSAGTEMSLIQASDFRFSFTGGGMPMPPTVSAVSLEGGNDVKVDFDRVLPLVPFGGQQGTRWSCLGMACAELGHKDVCWTHLPADVDGGCVANAADVLTLIDNLNGVLDPPLEWYQCDVDDSGVCNSADVLGVIDLLNGASEFDKWINFICNGAGCPTAP